MVTSALVAPIQEEDGVPWPRKGSCQWRQKVEAEEGRAHRRENQATGLEGS